MKNLLNSILLYCILFTSQSLLAQSTGKVVGGMSEARLGHYENFLKKEIQDNKIAGAVSLVWRKGEITHHQTFGKSSLEGSKSMGKDQIFFIQSMTKPIITVAFMMLYEEGHFQLSDPVSKYIPAFT